MKLSEENMTQSKQEKVVISLGLFMIEIISMNLKVVFLMCLEEIQLSK